MSKFAESPRTVSVPHLPVQDPEKRASLIAAIGAERLEELLALIPSEIDKVVFAVDTLRELGNPAPPEALEKLNREAHGLKGVAVNYGLARLAHVAEALQDYRRTLGDIDLLRRSLQECAGELADLVDQ